MYYLSYFGPFGRQKVEKAPSWLHLWLAFSTNTQNSKIQEVVTAPLKFTTEVGRDFGDGWLPTLDVSIKMEECRNVLPRGLKRDRGEDSSSLTMRYPAFATPSKRKMKEKWV